MFSFTGVINPLQQVPRFSTCNRFVQLLALAFECKQDVCLKIRAFFQQQAAKKAQLHKSGSQLPLNLMRHKHTGTQIPWMSHHRRCWELLSLQGPPAASSPGQGTQLLSTSQGLHFEIHLSLWNARQKHWSGSWTPKMCVQCKWGANTDRKGLPAHSWSPDLSFICTFFYLGSCVTCSLLLFQQDTGTESCHKNWVVWRVSPNPLTPTLVFTSGSQNTSLQRGRKDDLAHQVLPQACQSCILQVPLPAPVKTSAPLLGYSWHHHSKSWISSKECAPRYFFWDILCLKIKKPTHTQIRCNHTHVLFLVLRKAHLQWGHPQTEIRVICLAGFPGGIHNKKDTASVLKISVYIHHASSSDFKL